MHSCTISETYPINSSAIWDIFFFWWNKYLRESWSFQFGLLKFGGHNCWKCNCNPISLAEAGGPTFTITLSLNTTPLKEEIDYAGMSPVWQSIQGRGISEVAAKLIMASWRDGTKKQYSTYITKWQKFCNQRQISHIQPSVVYVLDFLTLLYQQGLTYSAINTAQSALSSYITLENGTCVGKHPLVPRLMWGIFQEKPPRPKYTEIWDVSIGL